MNMRNWIACCGAGVVALAAGVAEGQVVVSNFSAGIGSSTVFGSGSFTTYKAYGFLMGDDPYDLDEVLLSMDFGAPLEPVRLEVSIWSGAAIPETELLILDNPDPLEGEGDFSFTPPTPFVLEAGMSYWVYVDPITPGAGPGYNWDATDPATAPFGPGATTIGYIFDGSPSSFMNRLEVRGGPVGACYADCDGDGELTFFDFLCFQNLFAASDPGADCDGDGSLTFFDFLCFQNEFAAGCP